MWTEFVELSWKSKLAYLNEIACFNQNSLHVYITDSRKLIQKIAKIGLPLVT